MPENKDDRDTSKNTLKTGTTRRGVLANMVGVGASGMLAERSEAHARRVHAVRPFATTSQQHIFKVAVDAFNSMGTVVDISQSQLWNVFDPSVVIYDITFDHAKLQGLGPGVANPLEPVVYGLYALVGNTNGQWLPNFNPWGPPPSFQTPYGPPNYSKNNVIKGYALWQDSGGSGSEVIHYTFRFNPANNLLVEMHGR